jgi:3-phosphoshikimate 1-carboxyvinyltransferase
VLLAALNCAGQTSVIEPEPTRDHTERMLPLFGADIDVSQTKEGERQITITGHPELKACALSIPGDPSSAAFLVVAALLTQNSHIIVKDVLINPLRTGLYDTLLEMGAVIDFQNKRETCGEIVADLHAASSTLTGINVAADRAPSMIDEYPILAVAAAFANGHTRLEGLSELRHKESDRLTAIADGLRACGIKVDETPNSLVIEGAGSNSVQGGAEIRSHSDHRIAMSFLTLGLAGKNPVSVDGAQMIATSFPQYTDIMHKLGADIARGAE